MRAPLSWIREFTPLHAPPADIADALDQLGLEVEAVEEPGREIRGVVVARIVDVVAHPDADKIRLADVDFGDGRLRVVCGAPNIEPGMVVPFARVGAVLPGEFEITKRKIRGVVSEGMLCSARELGLGDDHAGILALPGDAVLGADVREVLGLDDVVFDLSITPNRPDAMGIVGIARDLAAHFGLPCTIVDPPVPAAVDAIGDVGVVIEAPDRCPRLVAAVASVTTGASPAWMQRRLTLAGMRPISNVVDVTNYVMLERCRPLHAFDLDRLGGRGLVVRMARAGEEMVTLDGVTRTLTDADLLICDSDRRPHAIAGIMGGADAEVSETTTRILLESAHFEPSGIARSSKRLGLRSEASARFERGVDPNGAASGAARALELLAQVAGATAEQGLVDAYPAPVSRPRITVRTPRVEAVLGIEIDAEEVRALLAPLGIEPDGVGEVFDVLAPTWRPDLAREIDVVEEVARRVGLDAIPRTVPSNPSKVGALTADQRERRMLADVLVGAGFDEAYTLALLAPADLARAGVAVDGAEVIEVENPLRAEESVLRPSLLPGLLRAAASNAAHGVPDVALFESGRVFRPSPPGETLPWEPHHLAFVRTGMLRRAPHEPDRAILPADAVAVVDAIGDALRLASIELEAATRAGFHPVQAARVVVGGADAGTVGAIDPAVVDALGLPAAVVACELDTHVLLGAARRPATAAPVSRFPASSVDLAFVVDETVPAAAVRATLEQAAGPALERIELFDVFRSEALGSGRTSLAFTLRFRAADRTLTDDEVAEIRRACIGAVHTRHDAELRA